MSYNLVDPVTGDLTQVAGNIRQDIIPADASASNKLATTDSTLKTVQLNGSVDCNTLTEPGLYTARAGAASALTNAPINQVQLEGGFSILVTASNTEGTFYGSQMFIPYGSDLPFIRKAYYFNNGQYWTPWEQLATMDKLTPTVGYITGSLLSSFVTDSNLYYQKFGDNKLVINGWVSLSSEVPNGTKIFTLPNGWKTNSNYLIPCYKSNSNSAYACVIDIGTSDIKSYTPLSSGGELRFCGTIYLQ